MGLGLTKFVEQFAAQLTSVEPQVLADLRAFVDWQTQAQGGTFICSDKAAAVVLRFRNRRDPLLKP